MTKQVDLSWKSFTVNTSTFRIDSRTIICRRDVINIGKLQGFENNFGLRNHHIDNYIS